MSNPNTSPLNNMDADYSPLPQPTVEQQLYLLQQDMHALQQVLANKQAREHEDDIEDSRIAKILKVTLASQAKHKTRKLVIVLSLLLVLMVARLATLFLHGLVNLMIIFMKNHSPISTKSSVQQTTCLVRLLFGGM